MTSKWVRLVTAQREYSVDWRFISLRLVNAHVDYAAQFPPDYEAGHTDGLRLLRLAARVRDEHGPEAVGPLYRALGRRVFGSPSPAAGTGGTPEFVSPVLAELDLPPGLSAALDDEAWDAVVQAET